MPTWQEFLGGKELKVHCLLAGLFAASTAVSALASQPPRTLAAPGLDPAVLELALRAADAARAALVVAKPEILTVIDYSLPSTEPRFWVLDRNTGAVLWHELVAHGSGTGENLATSFSNRSGSKQSSLGLFLTEETYQGRNGESMRLRGLDQGVNDLARERAIVIHGAPYVSRDFIKAHGRLGRSWGCPALRREVAHGVIDRIRGGSLVFIYYPNESWLRHSRFLGAATVLTGKVGSGLPGKKGS